VGLLEPYGRGRRVFWRDALSEPTAAPPIVVYSLAHATAALDAAAAAGRSIVLLSAPDAGVQSGAGWFKALIDAARAAVPTARCSEMLDCGEHAGAAMAALRAGIGAVIFGGRDDVAERLTAIAAQQGARLLRTRPQPALDLAPYFFADDKALCRRCADALAGTG
jgi:hypothetical protein